MSSRAWLRSDRAAVTVVGARLGQEPRLLALCDGARISDQHESHSPVRLDAPAPFDEVAGEARADNKNHRERQQPGPPAVSCDEHIDLPFIGFGPITKRPCASQYLPKAEKSQASSARPTSVRGGHVCDRLGPPASMSHRLRKQNRSSRTSVLRSPPKVPRWSMESSARTWPSSSSMTGPVTIVLG